MTLFRKKTADEIQDKIIQTIQEYKDSFNARDVLEEKIKESRLKATVSFVAGATAGVGGFVAVAAAAAGVIAAPVAMTALTIGTGVGWIGLGYAGINHLIKKHHEKAYYEAGTSHSMYKNERAFENKLNKILSKTEHGQLNHDEMFKLKTAVVNDTGTSLDQALREMNLPDTKYKKVFKESLKTGLGLTLAMGGGIAAIGGISAASLTVTGLGVIAGVGALTWSGIRMAAEAIENHQIKKHFAKKNDEDIGTKKAKLSI